MPDPVYLDYNATTPLDPAVIAAIQPSIAPDFGNPSSSHWFGIAPRQAVMLARRQVADLLNCRPDEIVFTSGGTEANNHAIAGCARASRSRGNHVITSAVEHPAVLNVCRALEGEGIETTILPVDAFGRVAPEDVEAAIRPETILISIMHANNETGTVQPIEAVGAIARRRGIALHTDAAQSAGKITTDVERLSADLLSIAGHKLYAPKGIGALYVRASCRVKRLLHGAGQENGRRAGTENVIGIVGLGAACAIAGRDLENNMARMRAMRERLYSGLMAAGFHMRLNGHPEDRLPNTLNVSFAGFEAGRLLEEIGLEVAASAGAACHADSVAISHVLEAMRLPMEWARGTLRFSTGRTTTETDIDRAVAAVTGALKRMGRNRENHATSG